MAMALLGRGNALMKQYRPASMLLNSGIVKSGFGRKLLGFGSRMGWGGACAAGLYEHPATMARSSGITEWPSIIFHPSDGSYTQGTKHRRVDAWRVGAYCSTKPYTGRSAGQRHPYMPRGCNAARPQYCGPGGRSLWGVAPIPANFGQYYKAPRKRRVGGGLIGAPAFGAPDPRDPFVGPVALPGAGGAMEGMELMRKRVREPYAEGWGWGGY